MNQKLKFVKMHGCGNDYIFFDLLDGSYIQNPKELSIKLSNRNFSIGSDGIVLIKPSDKYDCYMQMFNSDGSEGAMCGNAIRCVSKYLYSKNLNYSKIDTLSGLKYIKKIGDNWQVDMGIPIFFEPIELKIMNSNYIVHPIDIGNFHFIIFNNHIESLDLKTIGPIFENSSIFEKKPNTSFIKKIKEDNFKMRVWEVGSGETMACGSGASAAVASLVKNNMAGYDKDIRVALEGGELIINYDLIQNKIYMKGPAEISFKGEICI